MTKSTGKRFPVPRHWTLIQRLDHYTDKSGGPDACWPWTGTRHTAGYGLLGWKGKMQGAHRLAWVEANGPIPPGLHVLHECDNPPCRNEAHLFLGAHADNMADKIAKGRQARGEGHYSAKLTEADVRAIRTAAGTLQTISRKYGVAYGVIGAIKRREIWKHVL